MVEVSETLAGKFSTRMGVPPPPPRPTRVRGLPPPMDGAPMSDVPSSSLGLNLAAAAMPAVPHGRVPQLRRVENQAIVARVITQRELLQVNEERLGVITPFIDEGIWQGTMTYHDQGLPYGAEKFLWSSGAALTSEVGYFVNIQERCSRTLSLWTLVLDRSSCPTLTNH